jgi:uncharacterized membrane protein
MSGRSSSLLIVLLLVFIPFGYAFYLWPDLPESIPTHFDINGKPDAWGKKESIFILPVVMGGMSLFVYLLLTNIRKLDPKRYGTADDSIFRKFAILIVAFMSLISLVILVNTIHRDLSMNKIMFVLLGIFFAAIGMFMPRIKQNYFAGFRLPWTLDNEQNWIATHQLAGKFWVIGGAAQALAALIFDGKTLFFIFFAITMVIVIVPVVFSYSMFRQAVSKKQK